MEQRILTKEVREVIETIASRLPKIPVKVNNQKTMIFNVPDKKLGRKQVKVNKTLGGIPLYENFSGAKLLSMGHELYGGEPIDERKMYVVEVGVVCVNHVKELEKAFLRNGSTGTSEYIDKVRKEANAT